MRGRQMMTALSCASRYALSTIRPAGKTAPWRQPTSRDLDWAREMRMHSGLERLCRLAFFSMGSDFFNCFGGGRHWNALSTDPQTDPVPKFSFSNPLRTLGSNLLVLLPRQSDAPNTPFGSEGLARLLLLGLAPSE
ncbi:exported hypothetical protein [Mesorhizobium sp. ORS 3324]|nr:exported hypothetical protein [Mesorhizobium sp. ORS 3324]